MFEWDPKKSKQNFQKHGVTFEEATVIWQGICLAVEDIARTSRGEKRSATIGMISGKIYTAIWARRQESIRLISVRRSRDGEKKAFKNRFFQDDQRNG